jgi:hypothetical protein
MPKHLNQSVVQNRHCWWWNPLFGLASGYGNMALHNPDAKQCICSMLVFLFQYLIRQKEDCAHKYFAPHLGSPLGPCPTIFHSNLFLKKIRAFPLSFLFLPQKMSCPFISWARTVLWVMFGVSLKVAQLLWTTEKLNQIRQNVHPILPARASSFFHGQPGKRSGFPGYIRTPQPHCKIQASFTTLLRSYTLPTK